MRHTMQLSAKSYDTDAPKRRETNLRSYLLCCVYRGISACCVEQQHLLTKTLPTIKAIRALCIINWSLTALIYEAINR